MISVRLFFALASAVLLLACAKPAERAAEYVKSAQAFYDSGDMKKAQLEARNALQIEPKNAPARFILARAAGKQGNYKDMYGNLMIAVESDPRFVDARVDLGTLYALSGQDEEAAKQAEAAAAVAPDDPGVHVLKARLQLRKDARDAALKELDAALAKDPGKSDAAILKADLLARTAPDEALRVLDLALRSAQKEDQKALRTFRASILKTNNRLPELEADYLALARDYPDDNNIQNSLAVFYASSGRLDEAEKALRASVARNPKSAEARLNVARFLIQYRSPADAEKALQGFVEEVPDSLELKVALGQFYEATLRPDDALKTYEALAAADPRSPEGLKARVRMGAIYLDQGRGETGRAAIESVLKDQSDNPDALLMRGSWRLADRQYDDAVADFRFVLRREPKNRQALLALARTYAFSSQTPLAKDTYRELLAVDPTNADAPRELAELVAAGGNVAEAEALLRKRLASNPGDSSSQVALVDLLLGARDLSGAEAAARQMVAGRDDEVGQLQLARALLAQQKYPTAIEAFKRVLDKNPRQVAALDGLVASYLSLGRKDDAVTQAEDIVARFPDSLAARFTLASTYGAVGRTDDAGRIYAALAESQPGVGDVWTAWSGLYPTNLARRLEILRQGQQASPGNEELALAIGQQLEMAGRADEAIAHYEQVLKSNGKMDVVANNLAVALLDRRSDKASFARALELAGRFSSSKIPVYLDTLGWAYFRNGDFLRALPLLQRAVTATDEAAAATRARQGEAAGADAGRQAAVLHYHLGMTYLASQNPTGARQELTKALADPGSRFVGLEEARASLKKLAAPG